MSFDPILAVQRAAALAVIRKPAEYHIRSIFRWYSETFHTPLTEVDALPLEYVLQHYFEVAYEQMEGPQLEEEMARLARTEEEQAKIDKEEVKKKLEDDDVAKDLEEKIKQAAKSGKSLADSLKKTVQKPKVDQKQLFPDKKLEPIKLPEGIQMKFDESDLAGDPEVPDRDSLFTIFDEKPGKRNRKAPPR